MPHTVVIFGASGDLTRRKLIPALYELHRKKRLPAGTRIVGVARTEFSSETWREELARSTREFVADKFDDGLWADLAARITYCAADATQQAEFERVDQHLQEVEGDDHAERLYYMSTHPSLYVPIVGRLGEVHAADQSHGSRRLIVEKPFGTDFQSAAELNRLLQTVFREDQIYRIDHYLGKESVQNLLVLRFANTIFEPIWNRNYIDHVQITVAEAVGVGTRAGYYDKSGVLRDMIQNHLLQLMMICAMEAPARFEPELVRDEKAKVLRSVRIPKPADVPWETLRGQYKGYREAPNVPADSQTATYAAVRLHIDNWRWQGVPFYLRSGKSMSCRTTQMVIQFRKPPHMLFESQRTHYLDSNRLVIQIQPAEGIQLHFQTKVPDAGMELRLTDLDFRFSRQFTQELPDAYQRLLLDAMQGDASLFARSDEVELAWKIVDPIVHAWAENTEPDLWQYEPGFWGPEYATQWMRDQGREWFDVCPILT